jgi:hypothetical protein
MGLEKGDTQLPWSPEMVSNLRRFRLAGEWTNVSMRELTVVQQVQLPDTIVATRRACQLIAFDGCRSSL